MGGGTKTKKKKMEVGKNRLNIQAGDGFPGRQRDPDPRFLTGFSPSLLARVLREGARWGL